MNTIDNVRSWADAGQRFLSDRGSVGDFTEATLGDLDLLLARHEPMTSEQVQNLGCYLGEVVCRALAATWSPYGRPPNAINEQLEVTLPHGAKFWPVAQVANRAVALNPEDHATLRQFVSALRAIDARDAGGPAAS